MPPPRKSARRFLRQGAEANKSRGEGDTGSWLERTFQELIADKSSNKGWRTCIGPLSLYPPTFFAERCLRCVGPEGHWAVSACVPQGTPGEPT
jgi:hypothetical protein